MRAWTILLILVVASTAHAEPIVLAVDGHDIYVGLGANDGVDAGSELELLHEVSAKDPRTGATLRDQFALGTLTVAKAGAALCVAHADAALSARVLAGDHVRLVSEKLVVVDPWAAQVAASKQVAAPVAVVGAPVVDHTDLAKQAWQDTLGEPPEQRIARWQQLVAADPRSPYAAAIATEIASLRAQVAARDAALARQHASTVDDRDARVARLVPWLSANATAVGSLVVAPIGTVVPDHPIDLVLLMRVPASIGAAWLYVRPHGDAGFHRVELHRDGDADLRATIDATLVRGPSIEWYVEVAPPGAAATSEAVLGSADQPQTIEVERAVAEAPIQLGRTHVDMHVDYVDFDGKLSQSFDQYYLAEIEAGYRFIDPLYAVRLGFGTLSGIGGPKDVIDAAPNSCVDTTGTYRCKRVTFSYVFTELEYRLRPNVAVMLRPQIGELTTDTMPGSQASRCQGSNVAGCTFDTGFGARARIRFGEELGTNLVVGAAFTRGVGTLLEAAYHWLPAPILPVQLMVEVTDQPVIEDFGVRLIGDVGLRTAAWFYPSLRVSYQARDINHAGVSGGAALNFDW